MLSILHSYESDNSSMKSRPNHKQNSLLKEWNLTPTKTGPESVTRLKVAPNMTDVLKGICQDFENFVNVLWIRSLIHVDLICERNFEIGFIVLSFRLFIFPPKYFFENDSEKKKTLAIVWRQSDSVTHWSSVSDVAIFLLNEIEHGYHFDVTHWSEWALLVGEAWREMCPFLECIKKKTKIKMLIFWKLLAIYQNNLNIFLLIYIFYLKIKKSCRCKNLGIFSLTHACSGFWFVKATVYFR